MALNFLPNGAQVHGLGDDFVIVRRVRLGDGPVKRPAVAVSQQACTIISASSFCYVIKILLAQATMTKYWRKT
jgi:hypothetical protein